jgi:septal ring factor EnvC (AmiA/AmiB activator)
MKTGAMVGMLLLLLGALPTASASGAVQEAKGQATPISKVLELMDEMAVKGRKELEAEETKFTAFWQWCGDQTRIYNDEIAKATAKMEALTATIERCDADIKFLTARINELEEDVGRWTKDKASATDVDAKEKADYQALAADYTESLTALDGAIIVLKKQAYNRPQAEAALLQVHRLRLVPASSKRALMSFLQQPSVEEMPDERLLRSSPEASGYEFQSTGVIDMLEKLKDEFGTKKYELDKDELTRQHAFEQIMQQLTDNIENAEHEISKKTVDRAETEKEKAEAEGDLAATTAARAEDQKYLDEMTALCEVKKSDFESRKELREQEIATIKEAIEIISSQSVAGTGEKYLPGEVGLAQQPASLAQLRGEERNPLQARIASFLATRGKQYNSKLLAMVSVRVAADPFTKVKKMIKDLIWKLTEEGTAETEHKGWCDTELTTNQQTREYKTSVVNELTATEEDLTAHIAKLTQELETLTEEIATLTSEMAEATEDRATSKATNEQTIADAKEAQTAVQNAIALLKDFYAKSATATALTQQPAEDAPETFDKPYKGMLPEGGNVVDFLEVILTDFARLESETTTAEATELAEYKKYYFEAEKDKASKETSVKNKTEKKTELETELQQTIEDLKATQEQLDAAIAYYEKLKPTCVDSGVTYEDRVKRREAEMQSLKEALGILQGTDIDLA